MDARDRRMDGRHWLTAVTVCVSQLFLGTKEFPEEDGYSKFLSQNGGYSNAYTASEDTNFFFEVCIWNLFFFVVV